MSILNVVILKKPTSMRMRLLPWGRCDVCGGKRDREAEKEHGIRNIGTA
jgi:hypothetical protein